MIGSKRSEEREEDETLVAEILDKNLEGLGRPLKASHTYICRSLLMIDADSADYQESRRNHHDLQNHQFGTILSRHNAKDHRVRRRLDRNAATVSLPQTRNKDGTDKVGSTRKPTLFSLRP